MSAIRILSLGAVVYFVAGDAAAEGVAHLLTTQIPQAQVQPMPDPPPGEDEPSEARPEAKPVWTSANARPPSMVASRSAQTAALPRCKYRDRSGRDDMVLRIMVCSARRPRHHR